MRSKPLNYGKLADIEQEEKEAPGKFLDRLREGPRRFTEIDPKSEEGKVILKDRFLTQSAPDILCKLSKWAYGPNQSLDILLQLAQTVYYGREYEEKKERQNKAKEKVEAFAMAMKNVLKQPEKNAQRRPGEIKSRTRLSDFTFTFHFHALEKEMAPHSSVLAWRIPGTGEPGGLLSVGSHRVGHD